MPQIDPNSLVGREGRAADGQPLGPIEALFFGQRTGEPEFAVVEAADRARAGSRLVAIPLAYARIAPGHVTFAHPRAAIVTAPTIHPEAKALGLDEESVVLGHYESPAGEATSDGAPRAPASGTRADADGETVDVVRSEEQLVVDTPSVPTERVRLRKVVVTEPVTVTVNVRREQLQIDREPVSRDTEVAGPGGGEPQLAEGEMEFVLLAEEPVVSTRVVPVERIRVAKHAIVEEREISGELRKERLDVDREEQP